MNYGEYSGDYKYREIAANWLTSQFNFTVNKDNLFVSNGNSEGLNIVLRTLFKEGDSFFVEAPTYMLALPAFNEMKFNVQI
jgi:DNA-binding transcriptional MocR family regulator